MTREEQISEASAQEAFRILCEETDRDLYEEEVTLGAVFRKGARWADANPCWRYIGEDDLPSEVTDVFAIIIYELPNGNYVYYTAQIAFYPKGHKFEDGEVIDENGEWINSDGEGESIENICAWMPRPQFDFEKSRKLLGL